MKFYRLVSLLLISGTLYAQTPLTTITDSKEVGSIDNNFYQLNLNKADINNVVDLTSNQVIGGTKTFTNIIASTITATNLYGVGATPIGSITMFGGSTAPTGWMLCDGTSLSTTTYSNLFSVTGYSYGGTGANFNLPDMRGVFPKGAGTTNRAAGKDANGNYYAGTLGAYATDKFQGHWHQNVGASGAGASLVPTVTSNGETLGYTSFLAKTIKADGTNGTPRVGMTTEPQSLSFYYIIKY